MIRLPRRALRVGQGILIVAILWGVWRAIAPELSGLDWRDVHALSPRPGRLLLSTAMLSGVNIGHAFLWRRIMTDLAVGWPNPRETIRIYFLASLGRYLPGKLWQLAGVAVLSRDAGLPGVFAAACAVIGQLAFVITGFLLLALLLPEWGSGPTALIAGCVFLVLFAVPCVLVATPAGRRAREGLRTRLAGRTARRVEAVFELADRVRTRSALTWLLGYGLSWVAIGLSFALFVSAFLPQAAADVRHLSGSIAASYLAGYVTFVPAGLGVRESALWGLLQQLPAVPVAAALAIAVLARVWFTAAEVLPLALLPLLPGSRARGEV